MVDSKTIPIEDKLPQAWRQQRRYYHLRGASRFLIWLVVMIVLDFLIDWGILFQIRLTTNLGLLLLSINVVVLGWVLWHEWLRNLKPYDPLLVALEVEAKHPELSSLLVSYTQLTGPDETQPDVSAELIEAMRHEAVVQTHKLDFREIVDFGQLRSLLLVAGLVLAFFSAASFFNQEHLRTLVQRLAGIDVTYPTRTQIIDVSGDLTVRLGDPEPTVIVARASGVIPDGGRIFTRPADGEGKWTTLPLKKNDHQPAFGREFKEIVKDLVYYVRIGDAQSEEYRIHVVPAPRIVATKVDLSYPSYMEKAAGQVDQLNLEVPDGTTIHWHLTCDTAIKRLLVKTDRPIANEAADPDKTQETGEPKEVKYETIEARIDATGKNVTFTLLADRGFKYTFRWTEQASGKDFEYNDVQHSVRVIADTVPEVQLVHPASGPVATVNKTVTLEARANDDHGLGKAWLVYSLDGSVEKRVPIHDFKGVRSDTFSYHWELKKSIKDLQPNVQIMYAVEVVDRNPAAQRHIRRSATRQFTVVEDARYDQWARGQFVAQFDEVTRVKESEQLSSRQVKQLKEQETVTP